VRKIVEKDEKSIIEKKLDKKDFLKYTRVIKLTLNNFLISIHKI